MSEYRGYKSRSLEFLKKNNIKIGDSVKISSDLTYEGILMPRYEQSDDQHLVLKLNSGYNVGLEINEIKKVEKISSKQIKKDKSQNIQSNTDLPKILLLSTGGTIASKVDYRTGAVTPALSAADLKASVPELNEIANIDAEVVLSEYSENLQPDNCGFGLGKILRIIVRKDINHSSIKSSKSRRRVCHGISTNPTNEP